MLVSLASNIELLLSFVLNIVIETIQLMHQVYDDNTGRQI